MPVCQLVNVQTRDGVRLDGIFRKPVAGQAARLGVDVVILHHGVGGHFYAPGMFEAYSDALLDSGCAVLRVNSRGHDFITRTLVNGEFKRLGAAYEDMDECRHDWAAWIDFAQAADYQRIGLWGHSLGATKSIYYMAVEPDPRVKCVVAGSPPRFSYSAYAAMAEGQEFLRVAAQAQQYIDSGQPQALLELTYPVPLVVTARTFVDKYGPDEKYDILKYIPDIRVPLLITIGTEEAQTMTAFKGLPPQVERLAKQLNHLTFESIPGADHAYTLQREYVWDLISRWLEKA